MAKTLHTQVLDALRQRAEWEEKQRFLYALRHGKLERAKKPFPGAANSKCRLSDSQVDKAKPFFWNQLFSDERVAEFTGTSADSAVTQEQAADYLDWYCKHKLPLASKVMSAVDSMLMRQRGILKVYWDPQAESVKVDVVDPQFFVVPERGVGPDEDDWFCHIKQVSVAWYQRQQLYNQDPDLLARIRGGAKSEEATNEAQDDQFEREGLTRSDDEDSIIIWETWEANGNGWLVRNASPAAPGEDLRPPFQCPYEWQKKKVQPFVSVHFEVCEESWYAPRGIVENVSTFELQIDRANNFKFDWMTFLVPMFTRSEDAKNNTLNFSFKPGEVLPRGIQPAQMAPPPMAFQQETQYQRMLAEDRVGLPDAGTAPDPLKGSQGKDKTARQVSYEASISSVTQNMRGWVFRQCLSEVYRRIWMLLVMYQAKEMTYWAKGQNIQLSEKVFTDAYLIQPAGAVDGWDKERKHQRAIMRKQMFTGDPTINQEELNRDVLNSEDPRLVDKLLIPQGVKASSEAEDEAIEIGIMLDGFAAQALPNEDHALRLKILVGFLRKVQMTGEFLSPQSGQLIQAHIEQHMGFLQEQNPQMAEGAQALIEEAAQGPQMDLEQGGPVPFPQDEPMPAMAGGGA